MNDEVTRKRRDREATRGRILKAATAEFARYGFAGARGERIAQRARSSERMVYYYFGSKEGLFRAALEGVYGALRDAERALRLDELPPLQALEGFCRFVWRYYVDHPEFISLVNTENLHQARHLRKSARVHELVSPVELYLSIASLGYFVLSNQHTLSAVLDRDLREPAQLARHWQASAEIIRRYVAS